MNFVSLIRSDYSATSASLIVEFTFVSVTKEPAVWFTSTVRKTHVSTYLLIF